MNRRDLLMGTVSLLAAGAVWSAVRKVAPGATLPGETPSKRAFVELLCDIIIPDTDTPGARRAGVPAFFFVALVHHVADGLPADLDKLLDDVRAATGRDAHELEPAVLQQTIERIDTAAYQGRDSYWLRLKKVVILGYYTSELGAARELRYELTPGRFDPDLPVTAETRALSNDWVGQHF